MELLQYLSVARKWWWLIAASTVLAAVSSLTASWLAVPVYKTSTTLIVSQITESRDPNPSDFYASQQLAQTYVQLVRREPVLSGAVYALGLNQSWQSLRDQVSAVPIQGTQLLEISVLDTSPERAKAIADELARQLILQSPTTPSAEEQERLAFAQAQLPDIEEKIRDARSKVAELDQLIATANSARQIQDAQQQQAVLQAQITQWQTTYAQLLESLQQGSLNYLSVVEPADIPRTPVSPKTGLNVLVASAIGLTLAVGAAFLLEYLDTTIRSPEEARELVGAPVLAAIGRIEGETYADKLVAQHEPRSGLTEAYRSLRTNLQFSALDTPLRKLLITSPGPSEGKSVTVANLAVVFARTGMSVLLVDADLRRPVLHKIFGLKNQFGLTMWLVGQEKEALAHSPARLGAEGALALQTSLDQYIQDTEVPGLHVITSGPLPPNPAEVLGSTRMRDFLEEAAGLADVVIIDSPPCVTVTDAVVLSRWCDGLLIVLDSQHTPRQGAQRARENLQAVGARILGAVVNRLDQSATGYAYYSYAYSYYYSDSKQTANGKRPNGLARLFMANGKSRNGKG